MPVPLGQVKADSVAMLGHPVRQRNPELLQTECSTVVYTPVCGDVTGRMQAARRFLTEMPAGQNELLAGLCETEVVVP